MICFACEEDFERAEIEQHHFPTPKRNGGALTIPLCRCCHDFVDRYTLDRWPIEMILNVFAELSRDARLFLLKLMSRCIPDGFQFTTQPAPDAGEEEERCR